MIATGIVPAAMEMMDRACVAAVEASIYAAGYPTDAAAVLLVELDGQADAVDAGGGDGRARCCAPGAPARVRSASSPADRARLWQGRKKAFGAMGRIAPDLAVQDAVVPRSALPDIMDRIAEIRDRHRLSISNVFHAGDGNLHPNISFDRRDPDLVHRVHVACTRDHGRLRRGRRQHHRRARRGLRQARLHAVDLRRRDARRDARGAPGVRSRPSAPIPARSCRSTPAANGARRAGGAVSDVVHGRLRALLGTSGVERDAAGLPRAIPESEDALSLVCRLAHEERWKIRVEGQGTWLSADAPADLTVSTRGLDQVLSVSPADLVATVQAGTPLEALRRRLADEGMWLAIDPPGRPERSLGSDHRHRDRRARCATASARCATTCSAARSPPATADWSRPAAGW